MRRNRNREYWTLTVLRIGSDDFSSDLEEAEFRFGRYNWELSDPEHDATRIPQGLADVVREADIVDEALEAGFTVEMTTRGDAGPGWTEFRSTVTMTGDKPWQSPRTLYAPPEGASIEMIEILSCSRPSGRMPGKIWIRVTELSDAVVCWAVEKGVFKPSRDRQMKLDNWFEFQEGKKGPPSSKAIPLPGPSERAFRFLGGRR